MKDIFRSDNIEIKYAKFGFGDKNLVIIPGLSVTDVTDNIEPVEAAYEMFTSIYTIYLFDRNSLATKGYSIKDMANDTYKAIVGLGIEKTDIFAVSQGAMIALRIAIDHPELVRRMVTGSTLAKVYPDTVDMLKGWINAAKENDQKKLSESFMEYIYSPDTIKAYGPIIEASFTGLTQAQLSKFIIMASALMDYDLYDDLKDLKVPMLLIGSKGDRIARPEAIEDIREATGCEVYMYPENFGHAVYDEAPDYKDRMLEFFKR